MSKTRFVQGTAAAVAISTMVAGYEGVRTKAYLDIVGVPTVCAGETHMIKLGMKFTYEECMLMLLKSIQKHEKGMTACMREPEKIPDLTFAVFNSFTYNVGVGAFCKSTMKKLIDQGQLVAACLQLSKWNKAGGKAVRGLTNRRNQELNDCLAGVKGKTLEAWLAERA